MQPSPSTPTPPRSRLRFLSREGTARCPSSQSFDTMHIVAARIAQPETVLTGLTVHTVHQALLTAQKATPQTVGIPEGLVTTMLGRLMEHYPDSGQKPFGPYAAMIDHALGQALSQSSASLP